jgi:outer membrane protease
MKKNSLLYLFMFLCFVLPVFQMYGIDLYLSPIFEYRNARLGEYVVIPESFSYTGKDWVLSDLQWQANTIFNLGAEAGLDFRNISFFTKALFGLPGEVGSMTDEDFILFHMAEYVDGQKLEYIYSKSNIQLDSFYNFLLGFSWNPSLSFEKNSFGLGTSFEWRSIQLTSTGGIQYMYLHDGTDAYAGKIALSGKGITYKQNIFLWWLNASFPLGLTKKLTADFIFSYSPFWYGEGYDRHHHRSLDFLDKVEGHTAYKLASHFMLQIREPVVLGLSINYLSIPMKVGSSASKKTWETQYRAFDSSLGGMSLSEFSTAVFLRYRFSF